MGWGQLKGQIIIIYYDMETFNQFLFPGWEVAGDHIRSGAGSSDNDYLILNIHIPGFKYATLPFIHNHSLLLW